MNNNNNINMDNILKKINEGNTFNEIEKNYNRIVLTAFLYRCFNEGDEFNVFLESCDKNEKYYCICVSISKKNNHTLNLKNFLLQLPNFKTTFSCILTYNETLASDFENNETTIYFHFQRVEDKDTTVIPKIPKLLTCNTFENLTNEFQAYVITDTEVEMFKHLYTIFTNLETLQPKVQSELTFDSKDHTFMSLSFYPINSFHFYHLVDFTKKYNNMIEAIQFNLNTKEEKYYPCYTFIFKRILPSSSSIKKHTISTKYNDNDDYSDDDNDNHNNNKRFKQN